MRVFAIIIFNLLTSTIIMGQNKIPENKIIIVEATCQSGEMELRINDLPVFFISNNDERRFKYYPARDFIVKRKNTIEVITKKENAIVHFRIAEYTTDEIVDGKAGKTILQSTHESTKSTIKEFIIPYEIEGNLNWINNDILTTADLKESKQIAIDFLDIIKKGNMREFIKKKKDKTNDPITKKVDQKLINDMQKMVDNKKKSGLWQFNEIVENKINCVLIANNKLIDIRNPDNTTFFSTKRDEKGSYTHFARAIGKENGKWKIYY